MLKILQLTHFSPGTGVCLEGRLVYSIDLVEFYLESGSIELMPVLKRIGTEYTRIGPYKICYVLSVGLSLSLSRTQTYSFSLSPLVSLVCCLSIL